MHLHITNSFTYFGLCALPVKTLKRLDRVLSYLVKGAYYSEAYKRHGWDGRKRLLGKVYKGRKPFAYRFPTGLLEARTDPKDKNSPKIKEFFSSWDKVYRSSRLKLGPTPKKKDVEHLLKDITLYGFQCSAVIRMITRRRGIVNMAVGSGKTEVAAAVIKFLGLPAVVLVPTLDLLYQTRERYAKRLNVPATEIGIIGEGQYEPKQITVASVPTLRNEITVRRGGRVDYHSDKAEEFFKKAKIVVSDEAHMVGDNTFFEVFMSFPNAEFRYGMSATPLDRSDGNTMMLIGATGPIIARVRPGVLMKHGILATPKITIFQIKGPRISGAISWQRAYHQGIVDNPVRNAKIIELVKEHKGQKILVMFTRIAHGKLLSGLLHEEGIEHELLTGSDIGRDREIARHKFEEGDLDVILASKIFELGVDLPAIKVLIRASGGKSTISTIQMLGRALRVKEGDREVFLFDFFDGQQKYLAKHSKQRLKDYLSIGDPVEVIQIDLESGQQFIAF